MRDREAAKQIKRLRALGRKWIKPLGLEWWDKIGMIYLREQLDRDHDGVVYARTWVDARYLEAEVKWSLPACEELCDADLERAFVHELMHIFLSPIQSRPSDNPQQAIRIEEVATQLARAVIWARKAGAADAQKAKESKKPRGKR